MTEDTFALLSQTCSSCGEPYHRYSPEDPEHEFMYVACVNALHQHIEELEQEIRRHHRDFLAISNTLAYKASNGLLTAAEANIRNIVG